MVGTSRDRPLSASLPRASFGRWWWPAGVDTLGWDIWFDAFAHMLEEPNRRNALVDGVDRMIGGLPGFESSHPFGRFLDEHASRTSVPGTHGRDPAP